MTDWGAVPSLVSAADLNELAIQGPHAHNGYLLKCSLVQGGEVGDGERAEFEFTTCSLGAHKKVYRKTPEQNYPGTKFQYMNHNGELYVTQFY